MTMCKYFIDNHCILENDTQEIVDSLYEEIRKTIFSVWEKEIERIDIGVVRKSQTNAMFTELLNNIDKSFSNAENKLNPQIDEII